jgi:hypothetical protein
MKKIICITLALVFLLSLAACKIKAADELVGIWSGSWEYKGHTINQTVSLSKDFTYITTFSKDGDVKETERGTYTFDDNTVSCHRDGGGCITEYEYSDGKLTNNGHSLIKQ